MKLIARQKYRRDVKINEQRENVVRWAKKAQKKAVRLFLSFCHPTKNRRTEGRKDTDQQQRRENGEYIRTIMSENGQNMKG